MTDEAVLAALKAHIEASPEWLANRVEEIVEPEQPIIDSHHHLWSRPGSRYIAPDLLEDTGSGHNIVATVHVQCRSAYRTDGPEAMKPVGETEFAASQAIQYAQTRTRLCEGIVGTTDLLLGESTEEVLQAHLEAGGQRFKGIRPITAWHESPQVRGMDIQPGLLMDPRARDAIRCIEKHGLVLDLWLFFTQLDEALDVCRSFPTLKVVINHLGGPVGIGPYAGRRDSMFAQWRSRVEALAQCPNAVMKLGGLGMRYIGLDFHTLPEAPPSDLLVEKWRPFMEPCIQSFGPERCMFESNFPVDRGSCSYQVLWNAFKKIAGTYPPHEKDAMFFRTAAATYRLSEMKKETR